MPGRPTMLLGVGQGPIALVVGADGVCLDILLSSILSLLFLPLSERRSDIDCNTVSRAAKPKTTNQPIQSAQCSLHFGFIVNILVPIVEYTSINLRKNEIRSQLFGVFVYL